MFDSSVLPEGDYKLEEGGFYVISIKDEKLILEHRFYYFKSFILNFYLEIIRDILKLFIKRTDESCISWIWKMGKKYLQYFDNSE